ncbi:vWA domain-containing protein [Ureibacillus manganicus]|uniref:VWFA domain-containing protein n=1 Tax=Ureibacillus manganicus DSM 26584 TaxID=1384049 RepID=A0A0A3HVH2_9BACL|nr:BatA and WFA domain-containing protein [Ureibacillus manganicus]KGR75230.1 hypothetical protein CD29_18080 [Ureibacillus manganicus DSM 26584]
MGFSNLIFAWTIILPMIVLVYYFFRKKYKDQSISSTMFWDEVMQETKVSPYLKHLQRNALLYLQLLALILFMLALMNPFIKKSEVAGEQIIWIVDTSATMLAGKEISTFKKHKEEMNSIVSEFDGRPLTIITTGEEPSVVIRQETETKLIHKTIDELAVTFEEEQLSKAIDVAQAFIGEASTSIYLFTDAVDRNELPIESERVKWVVKGADKDLENVAITKFAATEENEQLLAFVQLKNETEIDKELTLSFVDEKGEVVKEEKIVIEAAKEQSLMYDQLPLSGIITASIEVEDDYGLDNTMSAIIGGGQLEILVDQQMHALVQKGFQALDTDVKIVQSEQLKTMNSEGIIVTNQTELLESTNGNVILIGRDDEIAEEVRSVVDVSKDPLFTFSKLEDVYVSAIYPPFEEFKTIATIADQPFIQRSTKGDIAILADIESTDWPLHPSFPLILWSLHNELSEGTQSLGVFRPNESRAISLVDGAWSIYSFDDEYITSVGNPSYFKAPIVPGPYTLQSFNDKKYFVVQLSTQERSIQKGTSFELGQLQSDGEDITTKESLSVWFLLIILLLLVMEWEVQRRRGFTN